MLRSFAVRYSAESSTVLASAIGGTDVRLVNIATNAPMETKASQVGLYQIPFVLPGDYRLSVSYAVFKTVARQGIRVSLSTQIALDFVLEVGDLADRVEVTAATPVLNTTSAELGQVAGRDFIEATPVSFSRNILDMIRLSPGVMGATNSYTSNRQKDFSIRAARMNCTAQCTTTSDGRHSTRTVGPTIESGQRSPLSATTSEALPSAARCCCLRSTTGETPRSSPWRRNAARATARVTGCSAFRRNSSDRAISPRRWRGSAVLSPFTIRSAPAW